MTYLLLVIVYTAIMLVGYVLFLRNKPLYQFSRYYLLASAIVPLLLPLVRLPENLRQQIRSATPFHFTLPEIIVGTSATGADFEPASTIWFVYSMITLLFIGWHLGNGLRLWRIIKNNGKERHDNYTIITSCGYGPGSFGRYIFFPGTEVNNTILEHEQTHINLHHTRDILILNLLQALVWPNILLVWIRKELRQVHEFQADASVAANKDEYTALLLSSVFNTSHIPSMHLFFIHPIKRRIMMLQKKGKASHQKTVVQVCAAFSIFLILALGAQSCEKKHERQQQANTTVKPDTVAHPLGMMVRQYGSRADCKPDEKNIYTFAEKMPEPPYDLAKYISANIQYPEYAKSKKIEGRVVVKFVIKENGSVADAVVLRSPDNSLSAEALRVINSMPVWTPGEQGGKKVTVYFALPIAFKLS